jgi:cold shock CspA family protein
MSLIDKILGNAAKSVEEPSITSNESQGTEERLTGKIIKLKRGIETGGWGFISSKEIPFTRIFFHWSALVQDTLNFTQLEEGMEVEFTPMRIPEKGYRALKVKVIQK